MFLKKEPFKYNGETVTLFELSALQRIEFIGYLAETSKAIPQADDVSDEEFNRIATPINVKISSRLIAMSLWQADTTGPSVDVIHHEVLSSWPIPAIAGADFVVRELCGMVPPPSDEANVGDPDVVGENNEKPDLEKSTPTP